MKTNSSSKQRPIIHGVSSWYFKKKPDEIDEEYDDNYEESEESTRSSKEKRKDILKLMGNKKKLTTKADGLDKDIPIVERNKKRRKTKAKRKISNLKSKHKLHK